MNERKGNARERIDELRKAYDGALLGVSSALSRGGAELEKAYALAIAAKREYESEIESNFR